MFSAWCQSKLQTADCFCIELSGDAEFRASLEGQLWQNYETLKLCTGKSNACRVLEHHHSSTTSVWARQDAILTVPKFKKMQLPQIQKCFPNFKKELNLAAKNLTLALLGNSWKDRPTPCSSGWPLGYLEGWRGKVMYPIPRCNSLLEPSLRA